MQINFGQSVEFDPVPGAVSYEFLLKNAALSQDLGTFVKDDPLIAGSELLEDQPHGNYYVQCRAFDEVGPGEWSALLALEFVSLPAPQNGRVV